MKNKVRSGRGDGRMLCGEKEAKPCPTLGSRSGLLNQRLDFKLNFHIKSLSKPTDCKKNKKTRSLQIDLALLKTVVKRGYSL